MSSTAAGEEPSSKKRSQMIDKSLEEDSKKLRKECKILLLGRSAAVGGRDIAGRDGIHAD
jgi:hypothetical protein